MVLEIGTNKWTYDLEIVFLMRFVGSHAAGGDNFSNMHDVFISSVEYDVSKLQIITFVELIENVIRLRSITQFIYVCY